MIDLVLIVCLLDAPDTCREQRRQLDETSAFACMREGQVQAARWIDEHPTWRLVRWRCEPRNARQIPA